MIRYPTTYIDKFGKEETSFLSDGKSLKIQLRNMAFVGSNFDSLELEFKDNVSDHNFYFNEYESLTDCYFEIRFPLKVKRKSEVLNAILNVEIALENLKNPIINLFALTFDSNIYDLQKGKKREMCFESQMIHLQRQLPQDTKINSCIFCAYSNYWVAGSDSFGTLICYKDIKTKITAVNNKSDYIDVAENNGTSTQETFWCSEFMDIIEDQWQYKDSM